jgi:hypothetical protein
MTNEDKEHHPPMSKLREPILFPWDKHPPEKMHQMMHWYEEYVKPTMPADPTQDFFVGVHWGFATLMTAFDNGVPMFSKAMIFDVALAFLYYIRMEYNAFDTMDDFDKQLKTEVKEKSDWYFSSEEVRNKMLDALGIDKLIKDNRRFTIRKLSEELDRELRKLAERQDDKDTVDSNAES